MNDSLDQGMEVKVLVSHTLPEDLLVELDRREVALWLHSVPTDIASHDAFQDFIRLPWRMILSEMYGSDLPGALSTENPDDPMVRRRGFVQIIDGDPSQIELPRRCLPIYLLNGRHGETQNDFQDQLRRLTMLEELRRSGVRHVLIIADEDDPIPSDLKRLWQSDFRAYLTFASESGKELLDEWTASLNNVQTIRLLRLPAEQVVKKILQRYSESYPAERIYLRVRNRWGEYSRIDVTGLDDPERPLLDHYSLIEESHLWTLTPEQLSKEEFINFFEDSTSSWYPYAAGLPWDRNDDSKRQLEKILRKLDIVGSEENCVAYLLAEPGAGGTTLVRKLAWEYAQQGYPVLVAKQLPFVPDALSVANFLIRIRQQCESSHHTNEQTGDSTNDPSGEKSESSSDAELEGKLYEVPWIIVFDRVHWEYRGAELRRFIKEMEKQGRPVCALVVSGPVRDIAYFDNSVFKRIGELTHVLDRQDARNLGRHLNQFLRVHGKTREPAQWDRFYEDHTVRYLEGVSTFWVSLSFWIRGQYDLSESIQEWMYRYFKTEVQDESLRYALLEIAAMSSERLPLPEGILTTAKGEWPISHRLEDQRSSLGALGLTRKSTNGRDYWALVHDILGRFLINALFYDYDTRSQLGFAGAKEPEHLRFLLLKMISQKPVFNERHYSDIGEEFATSIFKIDPDHGHAHFVPYWREVLEALDSMASPLRDTSRVFRHHVAVSRRRIAKLDEAISGVTIQDRATLLNRAIEDINYALYSIEYSEGSEPDLNLYNSLAHAYHDLADVHEENGGNPEHIAKLRKLGRDATRQAYEENPTNSFVIETYIRDLLSSAHAEDKPSAVRHCVEALNILFSAISSDEESYRRAKLGDLADRALALLFRYAPRDVEQIELDGPIDVLMKAWIVLTSGVDYQSGSALSELPERNKKRAIDVLSAPAGQGNMQVIRFIYDLFCNTYPTNLKKQIEYLEQLQSTDYRTTAQLRLEYAILLYQNNRPVEGDEMFKALRSLWRKSEHFVQIPNRLRWLRDINDFSVRTVRAVVASDRDVRPMARVAEFHNRLAPFRPEEFGIREVYPGATFSCRVSFGHNGPFLRPVTSKTS